MDRCNVGGRKNRFNPLPRWWYILRAPCPFPRRGPCSGGPAVPEPAASGAGEGDGAGKSGPGRSPSPASAAGAPHLPAGLWQDSSYKGQVCMLSHPLLLLLGASKGIGLIHCPLSSPAAPPGLPPSCSPSVVSRGTQTETELETEPSPGTPGLSNGPPAPQEPSGTQSEGGGSSSSGTGSPGGIGSPSILRLVQTPQRADS